MAAWYTGGIFRCVCSALDNADSPCKRWSAAISALSIAAMAGNIRYMPALGASCRNARPDFHLPRAESARRIPGAGADDARLSAFNGSDELVCGDQSNDKDVLALL